MAMGPESRERESASAGFREIKADEDHAERSVEEFNGPSGQGDSLGWTFDRDEIHQRK